MPTRRASATARAVEPPSRDKPLIGMTSFGKTVLRYMVSLKPALEQRGLEVAVFHATGMGGRAFESLAAEGAFAAMGAASRGARVIMWEKAATMTSGAMGSGCDHWEMAATNPCSRVTPEELADRRKLMVPAQRFGTAAEFGELCAYLCSLQAGYITGQLLPVNGGFVMN